MARTVFNRARVNVNAAPGSGSVSLGGAFAGFQTFAQAGVTDGATVSYVIEDGPAWEVGRGVFHATPNTLDRSTILGSSNNGGAINASGNAVVYISALAQDYNPVPPGGTAGQVLTKSTNTDYDTGWTTPAAAGSGSGGGTYDTFTRFRFTVTSDDANSTPVIAEISVIDRNNTTHTPSSVTTSSNYDGAQTGAQAIDGNPSTHWASSGDLPQWIELVFSSAFSIGDVSITCGDPTKAPRNVTVQGSNDGTNYTLQQAITFPAWSSSGQVQTLGVSASSTGSGSGSSGSGSSSTSGGTPLNQAIRVHNQNDYQWPNDNNFDVMIFDTVDTDTGSHYSTSTGKYTCPVAGLYLLNASIKFADNSPQNQAFGFGICISGDANFTGFLWTATGSQVRNAFQYNRVAYFAAGTQLDLVFYTNGNAYTLQAGNSSMAITPLAV